MYCDDPDVLSTAYPAYPDRVPRTAGVNAQMEDGDGVVVVVIYAEYEAAGVAPIDCVIDTVLEAELEADTLDVIVTDGVVSDVAVNEDVDVTDEVFVCVVEEVNEDVAEGGVYEYDILYAPVAAPYPSTNT